MESMNPDPIPQDVSFPPAAPARRLFPSGKREFIYALVVLICGCFLCNSVFYGGLNLGFAIFTAIILAATVLYLISRGCKPSAYSIVLLVCSVVILGTFVRGSDAGVNFVLFCFLVLSVNLSLCLLAGQNRRDPKGFLSLLDAPRTVFMLGVGEVSPAFKGLKQGFQQGGTVSKKFGAVGVGLLLSIPLLVAVVSLLIKADAAFDGLLQRLPDWDMTELVVSVLFGFFLACYFYTRGTALSHSPKAMPDTKVRKGMNALTVNTVLIAVGIVYVVYLISQLAYFSGGFSGILPEGYTVAEYARRGFFEMAWLCVINLGIIALAIGLTSPKGASDLLTKLLCLFLGLVTLFLVVSASAKMFIYIDTYGLTRLRVLTEVIMIWLGLSTIIVCVWLFLPKLAYMKIILVLALVLGAAVGWADVDTVVARHNVNAYLSGELQTVDVNHLGSLGPGSTRYLLRLTQVEDAKISSAAKRQINKRNKHQAVEDIRDWNYADYRSDSLLFPDK